MREKVTSALRPSVAVLGFALFLAINAASVWGGVFPFLPLEYQTHDLLFWFYFAQSIAFFCTFLAAARIAYITRAKRPLPLTVGCASVLYGLGWICLIASIYLYAVALPLLVAAGLLLGTGAALFYLLWQRYFASIESSRGTRDMIVGAVFAAVIYSALYLIPRAVTAFLIPVVFLPLFGLALTLRNREIDFAQPMFSDLPAHNQRVYRRLVHGTWKSSLAIGSLAFCAGVMRALAIDDPSIGSLVNVLSMIALLAAAAVLLYFWLARGLNLSITRLYRMIFPLVITALVSVPFAPQAYLRWVAAGLYGLYAIASFLIMLQAAQISRDQGIHPVYAFGTIAGIVYALHDLGFLIGSASDRIQLPNIDPVTLTVVRALYLLALMFFVSSIDFKAEHTHLFSDDHIELLASREGNRDYSALASAIDLEEDGIDGAPNAAPPVLADANLPHLPQDNRDSARQYLQPPPSGQSILSDLAEPSTTSYEYRDRIDRVSQDIKRDFGLSNREAEILKLVAQGNTVPSIAEQLFISENTVRTHMKRLYAKLDIHKKQELIDLAHSYRRPQRE
ncbi:helix-turn-helix transcriptional regulator [Curtanaerobium respiraculi]|uniref:helix-turn-helix transcriptional regulator n=1 Tax=Curtanaerobium respiraculi TaxID=2949669 RepID=UPI0024B39894|nr:helix-turn-helix transcriptional regulator [Curtanaerobium respiraculi]